MKSQKQSTVAVGIIVAVAVIFFIVVLCVAVLVPDSSSAATADYGMQFTYMNVDVDWHTDRSCHVKQDLEVEFLDNYPSHGIYVDIPVNSGEKVRDISVKATSDFRMGDIPYSLEHENGYSLVRVVVGDSDRTFSRGQTLQCVIEYDYLTPVHPDNADILDINAIGYGWTSPIVSARVKVTFPSAPKESDGDYGVWVSGQKLRSDGFVISNDGKTFEIEARNIQPFKGVRVKCLMPSGVLVSRFDYECIASIVIGCVLVIAVIVLMLFVGKDKPLSPIVDYYPPRIDGMNGEKRHMLPVQMGKIIDGTCSNSDVTSLIFYWASKGYIAIEENDNDICLKKLTEVDAVTHYEKTMFDKIFSYGSKSKDGETTVWISALSGKFASTVNATKAAVNNEYKGKLYKTGFSALSVLVTVLCAVYGVGFAVLSTLRIGSGFFNLAGFAVIVPVLLAAGFGTVLSNQYVKLSVNKRRLALIMLFAVTVILAVGVMLFIPTDAMGWLEKSVFAVCLGVASALSPFLTVRTDFYTEQLNSIVGFRNFLRDAEKDRLEALIKDDPQYYYDILPYANVLGVSKIWADKFNGLTIEPPTYYRGRRGVSVFDVYVMTRLTSSIGRSLTYVPPKANSGSSSGGHFGGGHGGFGGGGGGRW